MSQSANNKHVIKPSVKSCAQQIFLHCIQYFTTNGLRVALAFIPLHSGLDQLFDRVETVARELLEPIGLKTMVSRDRVKTLFADARIRIEGADTRNFSYLVVPLSVNQVLSPLPLSCNVNALSGGIRVAAWHTFERDVTAIGGDVGVERVQTDSRRDGGILLRVGLESAIQSLPL